jgi:hypothetical protein
VPVDAAIVASVIRPVSATPVVALAVSLLVAAVIFVLLISYLFYWRSGRR